MNIDDILERYFDGGWLKYALAFIAGAAASRFFLVRGEGDALGFLAMFAIILLPMGLKYLNDRAAERHAGRVRK
jgi:hypothetical protein